MSDDDVPPNWNLLPYRATEFFGLESNFDRKDLKRAYNKWLKRYKPEKHPTEFQKIREAYEYLETRLRYGQSESNAGSAMIDPSVIEAAITESAMMGYVMPESGIPEPAIVDGNAGSTPAAPSPQEPESIDWAKLLEEQSPDQVYATLSAKGAKSEADFVALAILSDAVYPPEECQFALWLLKGLKSLPAAPVLTRLLFSLFRSNQVPTQRLSELLILTSKVIRRDHFYWIAEPLLDRLVRETSWGEFETTLKGCQSHLIDHEIRGRIVFTCHLLRRAIWLAPKEACDEMILFINTNSDRLDPSLEYEFELNLRLWSYVENRDEFLKLGPIAERVDQALRAYCIDPTETAYPKVIAVQQYIAEHPEEFLAEWPYPLSDEATSVGVWLWVAEEVFDRWVVTEETHGEDFAKDSTFRLLQQIDQQFPTQQLQRFNLERMLAHGVMYFLALVLAIFVCSIGMLLIPMKAMNAYTLGLIAFCIGVAIFVHVYVKPRTLDVWYAKRLMNLVLRNYRLWWRQSIARFHAATHLSANEVRLASAWNITHRHGVLNVSTWFTQIYAEDVALMIYGSAVKFLR